MLSSYSYPNELFELFKGTMIEYMSTVNLSPSTVIHVCINKSKCYDIESFLDAETFTEVLINAEIMLDVNTCVWHNLPNINVKFPKNVYIDMTDGVWSMHKN